jgi:pimeloyl-ACP methyl ester carboxylesterase
MVVMVIKIFILPTIENNHIFRPTKINHNNHHIDLNYFEQKLQNKLGIKSINLIEKDITNSGNKINIICLNNKNSDKWIIYSHGNAGCMYDRLGILYRLGHMANIVMFDYHGYGKSSGSPTEQNMYDCIMSVYDEVVKMGANPNKITLYGESLGTAAVSKCAHELAKKGHKINGLILQSGFSSLKNLVNDIYPNL